MIIPKTKPNGRKSYNCSLGKSGEVSVDLYNGEISYEHLDFQGNGIFPINISHLYSKMNDNIVEMEDGKYITLKNCNCGLFNKLNIDKRLVKLSFSFLNDESSSQYVLVDSDGVETVFNEKYFYVESGIKTYVLGKDVMIDEAGNMTYRRYEMGFYPLPKYEVFDVTREFDNNSGMTITGKYEGLRNLSKVNQDIDEIAQLKETIKNINLTIADLDYALNANLHKRKLTEPTKCNSCNNTTELTTTTATDLLDAELENLSNKKEYYQSLLEQRQYELTQLSKQVPDYYIMDSQGNIMGFAKVGEKDYVDSSIENTNVEDIAVYRLVLIADSNNNSIHILYDDNYKIEKVIDANDLVYEFKYNDKDSLESITDSKGRKIRYSYKNEYLIGIKYASGKEVSLDYKESNLSNITLPNSKKIIFDYSGGKVVSVKRGFPCLETETINENDPNSESRENQSYLITSKTRIDYVDDRTTVITDEKTGKTHTNLMNVYGETICEYDCKESSDSPRQEALNVNYNLLTDKKQFFAKPNIMAEELLTDSAFLQNTGSEPYIGEDENVYITSQFTNKKAEKSVSGAIIEKIKAEGITDLVFGTWAKAENSLPIVPKFTDYSDNGITDDNLYYNESLVENISNSSTAKFELRAEITYLVNGVYTVVEQYASFDHNNKNWQYCAFPITLSTKEDYILSSIKVIFDYSGQTGDAEFYGMSLKEADWKYTEFNEDKQVIYTEESNSDFVTRYEYDDDKNLVKSVAKSKINDEEVTTEYFYNASKNPTLIIDSLGNVTENEYNDKGIKIRSVSYNKGMPEFKYYEESKSDENGKETGSINEFGETVCEYEFSENEMLTSEKYSDGAKIGYGYDETEDTLLEITSTVEGKTNANTYEYTNELITGLTHNGVKYDFVYDSEDRKIEIKVAGESYVNTAYNDILENGLKVGRIITKTLATKETFITEEDEDGKTLKVSYKANENVEPVELIENIYDTCGNIIRTIDKVTNTTHDFIYDKYGRIVEKISSSNGKVIKVANVYNKDGSISKSSFEIDGVKKTSTNTYTNSIADKKLEEIVLTNGLTEDITYDKLNRVKSTEIKINFRESVLSKNLSYLTKGDRTSNLISAEWFGVNGIIKDNLTYSYDVKGNITAIKENGLEIVRYAYDGINRLIREDNRKLNKTTTYFYDEGGNLTDKYEYAYTLTDTEKLVGGERISYGYSDEGWRDLLLDYNGEHCEYNELGNPLIYRGKSLSWTRGRILARYDNATYTYNASGIRTQKVVNGVTTNFYLDGDKILAQDMYSATTGVNLNVVYTYGSNGVCGFEYDNRKFLYKKNIFGDILSIYNEQGIEIVKYIYDAWGTHRAYYLSNGTFIECDNILTQTTEENKLLAYLNPFRYRSYYFDIETGLYYLKTRYYDPETARFINADDISYLDPETLNGLNLFAYCANNPIMNVDPNGNFLTALVVGLIIGFGATVYQDYKDDGLIFNGSVEWYDYLGATLFGGLAGAVIGVAAPMIGTFLASSFTTGGVALASVSVAKVAAVGATLTGIGIVLSSANRPGDNQKQNEQYRAAMRRLGYSKKDWQWRYGHDHLPKNGMGYRDLFKFLEKLFSKFK